jgi:hypothetical protein
MDSQTIVAASPTAEPVEVDAAWSPMQVESPVARGAWSRDIEALCRALEAQQRAHFPKGAADEK